MFGTGGYAPSVSSFTNDSPLGWQGIDSAKNNRAPAYVAGYKNADAVLEALAYGKIDPYLAGYYLSSAAENLEYRLTPEQEKLYNNLLSRYNSQNDLIWQAEQLQALGLSNAGVLQTGGVHTASDMSNQSSERVNRMKSIANSLIDMTSRTIGAGIHGAALQGLKDTASDAIEGVVKTTRSQLQHYDRTGRALGSTVRFDTVSQKYNRRK